MPLYLDWHEEEEGVTAQEQALAHLRDLEVQDRYGVHYLSYWFDPDRLTSFCLVDAPSKVAAEAVHREAHGLIAASIIEVDRRQIDEFLGAIPQARPAEPYVETAFRAILFTDVEGSTALTQRLGDATAMRLLRRHDEIVRSAVRMLQGSEVKHTGDGISWHRSGQPSALSSARSPSRRPWRSATPKSKNLSACSSGSVSTKVISSMTTPESTAMGSMSPRA